MSDVLLLNADAQPTNYLPLSPISWKASITYLWMNKVTVLDWYDDWLVRSTTWETKVPAVVMLKKMQRRRAYSRFSKPIFLFAIFIPANTALNSVREET